MAVQFNLEVNCRCYSGCTFAIVLGNTTFLILIPIPSTFVLVLADTDTNT